MHLVYEKLFFTFENLCCSIGVKKHVICNLSWNDSEGKICNCVWGVERRREKERGGERGLKQNANGFKLESSKKTESRSFGVYFQFFFFFFIWSVSQCNTKHKKKWNTAVMGCKDTGQRWRAEERKFRTLRTNEGKAEGDLCLWGGGGEQKRLHLEGWGGEWPGTGTALQLSFHHLKMCFSFQRHLGLHLSGAEGRKQKDLALCLAGLLLGKRLPQQPPEPQAGRMFSHSVKVPHQAGVLQPCLPEARLHILPSSALC